MNFIGDSFKRLMRLRAGSTVKRYHAFPTLGNQTNGEHSHAVALLLYTLAPNPSSNLIFAALHHDIAEYDTGDCPANVKWNFPKIAELLRDAENKINSALSITVDLTEEEKKWLQLCDTLEYCVYALDQRRLGNLNMGLVFRRGMIRVRSYELIKHDHVVKFVNKLEYHFREAEKGNTPEDVSV